MRGYDCAGGVHEFHGCGPELDAIDSDGFERGTLKLLAQVIHLALARPSQVWSVIFTESEKLIELVKLKIDIDEFLEKSFLKVARNFYPSMLH